MRTFNEQCVKEIVARGSVSDLDVLRLRTEIIAGGGLDIDDAEALLSINRSDSRQSRPWIDLLVTSVMSFVIDEAPPAGYISCENADWLIARLAPAGKIARRSELELLIRAIERSRWSPRALVVLALEQVKAAIVDGDGPLREDGHGPAGALGEVEVELLRHILYAYGGDGAVPLARSEIEVLLDINDVWGESVTTGAWRDLLVKALINGMLFARGFSVPTREAAMGRSIVVSARGTSALDGHGGLQGYRRQTNEQRLVARLEREHVALALGETLDECAGDWLAQRIEATPLAASDLQILKALAGLDGTSDTGTGETLAAAKISAA